MNTISPKISIITATLNNLPALRLTTASIHSQTFRGFEHVVVDGGSSDGTVEWLATKSDSIRWLSEPDTGIADAMNKGLSMASGEWILFLHAGDTFAGDDSLEGAMSVLHTEADIVSHDVEFIEVQQSRIYKSHGFGWRINFKTIPHQGAFSRRTLFDRVGSFDTSLAIGMDYDFFLRAHRQGARVDVVDEVLTRMPATGVSSKLDWNSLRARFQEEKIVQLRHAVGTAQRLMYSIYWPPYWGYRRVRQARLSPSSGWSESP